MGKKQKIDFTSDIYASYIKLELDSCQECIELSLSLIEYAEGYLDYKRKIADEKKSVELLSEFCVEHEIKRESLAVIEKNVGRYTRRYAYSAIIAKSILEHLKRSRMKTKYSEVCKNFEETIENNKRIRHIVNIDEIEPNEDMIERISSIYV